MPFCIAIIFIYASSYDCGCAVFVCCCVCKIICEIYIRPFTCVNRPKECTPNSRTHTLIKINLINIWIRNRNRSYHLIHIISIFHFFFFVYFHQYSFPNIWNTFKKKYLPISHKRYQINIKKIGTTLKGMRLCYVYLNRSGFRGSPINQPKQN